jgi:hypothetical protein
MHEYMYHGYAVNPDTGLPAEYEELANNKTTGHKWRKSNADKIYWLTAGRGNITGTNTISFCYRHEIPPGKTVTYIRDVCADRPKKEVPERVRWTGGGDRVQYDGNTNTQTADLITVKTLIHSTISTPNARAICFDLKDFYLGTPMDEPEWILVLVTMIPDEVMKYYSLYDKVACIQGRKYIYARVDKGMYGLAQAGKLANNYLKTSLQPNGFDTTVIPGLWTDTTSDLAFALVVDDFLVRYTNKEHKDRLLAVLRTRYKVTVDEGDERFVGMTIQWDYEGGTVCLSMPGYIQRILERFSHPPPKRIELAPAPYEAPQYGASVQYAPQLDTTPLLDKDNVARIRAITGTLLYYARAIDCFLLHALGTIASQQAAPTEHTLDLVCHFLNYCACFPETTIQYKRCDMILHIESDASYLSEPKARS